MVIQVGEIYETNNFGTLEVIEYVTSSKVRVRFLATGYERYTTYQHIRNGQVKDLFIPIVYGVGYMGEGLHKSKVGGKSTKEYTAWHNMLQRCYDPIYRTKRPTYIGCSVTDGWHNFQVFAAWFTECYIEGYELDKDIKVPDNKVYGPDTCTFVTQAENSEAASAVTAIFCSPEGIRTEVYNISKFAMEKGLNQSHLSKVSRGTSHQHKGWKKWTD